MILYSSMRTDIPAFYSDWFYNRIADGRVLVRNPYYPQHVSQYRLTPDVVDIFYFLTKNPEPMLSRLDRLKAFRTFWHITLTPYQRDIEPNVPDKRDIIRAFKALSRRVGADRVEWRYDPIFVTVSPTTSTPSKNSRRRWRTPHTAASSILSICIKRFVKIFLRSPRLRRRSARPSARPLSKAAAPTA